MSCLLEIQQSALEFRRYNTGGVIQLLEDEQIILDLNSTLISIQSIDKKEASQIKCGTCWFTNIRLIAFSQRVESVNGQLATPATLVFGYDTVRQILSHFTNDSWNRNFDRSSSASRLQLPPLKNTSLSSTTQTQEGKEQNLSAHCLGFEVRSKKILQNYTKHQKHAKWERKSQLIKLHFYHKLEFKMIVSKLKVVISAVAKTCLFRSVVCSRAQRFAINNDVLLMPAEKIHYIHQNNVHLLPSFSTATESGNAIHGTETLHHSSKRASAGTLVVTTHRILWLNSTQKNFHPSHFQILSFSIPMGAINVVDTRSVCGFGRSLKCDLHTACGISMLPSWLDCDEDLYDHFINFSSFKQAYNTVKAKDKAMVRYYSVRFRLDDLTKV